VPAAQTLFISKSMTVPSRTTMNLESWPPISKTVSTSGSKAMAAIACAVISFLMTSAPMKSPTRYRPEPVVQTPAMVTLSSISSPISFMARRTASMGRPSVQKYRRATTFPSESTAAAFVLTEPMSTPRYTGARPVSGRG